MSRNSTQNYSWISAKNRSLCKIRSKDTPKNASEFSNWSEKMTLSTKRHRLKSRHSKKQLGIEDAPVDKSEKKSSKPGMQEYHGGYPQWTDKHKCLVKKHLTPEMYNRLKDLKTSNGFTLDYAMKAGVILPHVGVGIVNDGVESLNLYKELYDKIVEGWHGFGPEQNHVSNMNPLDLKPFSIPQETINK